MEKQDIIDFLKENLSLEIDRDSASCGRSGSLDIKLMLEGEEISSVLIDGSDIEDILSD